MAFQLNPNSWWHMLGGTLLILAVFSLLIWATAPWIRFDGTASDYIEHHDTILVPIPIGDGIIFIPM